MAHIISHLYFLLAQMCTWEQGFANPQNNLLLGALFLNTQVLLLKSTVLFLSYLDDLNHVFQMMFPYYQVTNHHAELGPWPGPWWPMVARQGCGFAASQRFPKLKYFSLTTSTDRCVACNHKWGTNETSKKGRHLLVSTTVNIYLNIAKINDTK